MAKTYFLDTAAATHDINAAGTTTLLNASDPTDSTHTVAATNMGGTASRYYEEAEDTGVSRTSTGTFTVEWEISTAQADTTMAAQLHRVNSSGTIQASSGFGSEKDTSATGAQSQGFTDPGLGTWGSTDRLVVELRVTNNATMGGNAGPTWDTGTANSEVLTPFTASSIIEADGSASGTGAATGDSATIKVTDGSSTGAGTVTGDSGATKQTDGSSDGVGAVSGDGVAFTQADGSSDGTSTVTGDSGKVAGGVGSSDGLSTATGDSLTIGTSDGTSDGVATATGVSGATSQSDASSAGVGATSGVSGATKASDGASDGTGSVSGDGATVLSTDGTSSGVGTASANSGKVAGGVGSSAGTGAVTGVGVVVLAGDASGTGLAVVSAVSGALVGVIGTSIGLGGATGAGEAVGGAPIPDGEQLATRPSARWAAPGVGRPFLRAKLPNDQKGKIWRQTTGLTFGGLWAGLSISLPATRDFRPRFGIGILFGTGYRFGHGDSDPFYAQPSALLNPYAVDQGIPSNQPTGGFLTARARWSVPGVGRPSMRSHYPANEHGLEWRKSIGLVYAEPASDVDLDEPGPDVSVSVETAATPTYTEELV